MAEALDHDAIIDAGDAKIDFATREIRRPGSVCKIEPRAASVLAVLVAANGAVVSRAALIDGCWDDEGGSDEAVSQAMAQLRRALADDFRRPRFIATVHKNGYRWLAPAAEQAGAIPARGSFPASWMTKPLMTGAAALVALAIVALLSQGQFSSKPVPAPMTVHKTVKLVGGKRVESLELSGDPKLVREERARLDAERSARGNSQAGKALDR